MLVATSASYHDLPIIKAILSSCQTIYTSQASNEESLKAEFGDHKVIIGRAPESFPDGVQVMSFSDLRKVIKHALQQGDQETGKLLTEYCGWHLDGILWHKHEYKDMYRQIGDDLPAEVMQSMFHCF